MQVCITLDSYTQARLCLDNTKTANKVRKIKVAIRGSIYGIAYKQLRLSIEMTLKAACASKK